MGILPAQSIQLERPADPECLYCDGAQKLTAQFYETKLFRVLIKRHPVAEGHVVIVPKKHDPHFYSFDLDQLEEFGYLIKKVSFIAMRLTQAPGFTMHMSDGAKEVSSNQHLEIDIIPRKYQDAGFPTLALEHENNPQALDDTAVQVLVTELTDLMQLPQ